MQARQFVLALAGIAVLTSSAASAGEGICAKLGAFHRAKFDQSVQPQGRRWIEMRWREGDFIGLDTACRSSPDAPSRELCDWLLDNTSKEFPTKLPIRMLECFGYVFPDSLAVQNWRSDISIWSRDRLLLLEIDFLGAGAVRLSSFAKDLDDALVEMPALADSPDSASKH